MKYLRIYNRGRWRAVHYMSEAGIRTLCGLEAGAIQAEVQITSTQPYGRVCFYCARRFKDDGSAAWR